MIGYSSIASAPIGAAATAATANGVSPSANSLVFSGFAPQITRSSAPSPAPAGMTFNGFAPSVGQGQTFSPSAGGIFLTGTVPTMSQGRTFQPGVALLSFAGYSPVVMQGNATELKPISIAQFRLDFPEFANTTKYTDAQIGRQLTASSMILGEPVWGDLWGYGIEVRTAHYLTIAARNAAAVGGGGVGGAVSGFMTSKQVDKASAGYDFGATTYEGAGFWNTTSYGIEFWQLMMLFGAGPIQL